MGRLPAEEDVHGEGICSIYTPVMTHDTNRGKIYVSKQQCSLFLRWAATSKFIDFLFLPLVTLKIIDINNGVIEGYVHDLSNAFCDASL